MPAPRKTTQAPSPRGRRARAAAGEGRAGEAGAEDRLHILMVASEVSPFAKTGGLADVAGALPLALSRLGHRVTLVMPRYRGMEQGDEVGSRQLNLGSHRYPIRFFRLKAGDRVDLVSVDVPELYDREGLYGTASDDYPDNAIRFGVLARAALEYAAGLAHTPFSVVHTHEWQGGLVPVYLQRHYADAPNIGGCPSVFTIHNLAFQGLFPGSVLPALGLPWDVYTAEGLEYWNQVSFLKAGINFSDWITTVSPRYAKEILTEEYGFGFDGVLSARKETLSGILNGIDVERWNPQHDPYIPVSYSAENLSGKLKAKAALLAEFRLAAEGGALDRPVIGMVSRLTAQKGFDLIAQALDDLLALDATYVMLGSGEPRFEEVWQRAAADRPERVGVRLGFDERLAHLIEAGSDMFLMPSRFEPCGLNQMYSLRYGTVPIVRATGGLDDTVVNYNERSGRGTGFKFKEYTAPALVRTVKRALKLFGRRKEWRGLQLAGMRQDCSWDASAAEYVKVYRSVRRRVDGIREGYGSNRQ